MKRAFVTVAVISVYLYVLRRYWDSGFISGYVAGHNDGSAMLDNAGREAQTAINKARG